MKTLRTPDDRFDNLEGYPFTPNYIDIDDGDGGSLRMHYVCLLYTSPSPRDQRGSRMPSSA